MNAINTIQEIIITVIPLVLAIMIHEVAHGWTAERLGDSTARQMGRITLNPISHIDLFGTIILPIISKITFGIPFGYAKPVPINFNNLRHPKKDMVWVAFAGPFSNICLAVISSFIFRVLLTLAKGGHIGWFIIPFLTMLKISVIVNVLLALINLIPIPPADGGRIAVGLLPVKQAIAYSRVEPAGMIILFALLAYEPLGFFSNIIMPVLSNVQRWLLQ